MIRLGMKNYNTTLTEMLQKYQDDHQVKLVNMISLQVKKILPSDQSRIIEQAKFTQSPLGKVFEKQIKTIENQGIKNKMQL